MSGSRAKLCCIKWIKKRISFLVNEMVDGTFCFYNWNRNEIFVIRNEHDNKSNQKIIIVKNLILME